MKFLVDECLSPSYVADLAAIGYPDSVHPMHVGLFSARDDTIVSRAFAEDRVIITANGRDYRRLLARVPIHPSAIIIEALERDRTWSQIVRAVEFIALQASPSDYMVNRVVEVSTAGGVTAYDLTSGL